MIIDPYRFGTVGTMRFLAHCDGSDGGTTFTEEYGHTLTRTGSPVTSTTQVKFGSASARTGPSYANSVAWGAYTDLLIGSADCGIQFWIFRTSTTGGGTLFEIVNTIMLDDQGAGTLRLLTGQIPSPLGYSQIVNCGTFTNNAWHHIEVDRIGSAFTVYVDGASAGTATFAGDMSQYGDGHGVFGSGNASYWYIDEVAIQIGAPFHTAPFTPPAAPF